MLYAFLTAYSVLIIGLSIKAYRMPAEPDQITAIDQDGNEYIKN